MPKEGLGAKDKQRVVGRNRYTWTKSDNQFVKDNFRTMSDEEMGIALKRTHLAVQQRRYRLGAIRKFSRPNYYHTIHQANVERNEMIRLNEKVTQMRSLIAQAEVETNNYKKDKIKQQLKKLSGL